MQRMGKCRCDGGYGIAGNIVTEWYIKQLTDENQVKYREKLKKQNPVKYKEYMEWEKLIQS